MVTSDPSPHDPPSLWSDVEQRRPQPDRPLSTARRALYTAGAFVIGGGVALLGTATQRTIIAGLPVGLALAFALTLAAAVMCRAWSGYPALVAAAIGWGVAAQIMTLPGSGGDVLVTDPSADIPFAWSGIAWTYGGLAAFVIVALLPRRWFARHE
jgi:hypothetical protein